MNYPVWPITLRKQPKLGMRIQFQTNKISFAPAVGPELSRRRASVSYKRCEMVLPLSESKGEPQAFIQFYEQELKDGSLPFTGLRDAFGVLKLFRIIGEPRLEEAQHDHWELALTLEEVPQ